MSTFGINKWWKENGDQLRFVSKDAKYVCAAISTKHKRSESVPISVAATAIFFCESFQQSFFSFFKDTWTSSMLLDTSGLYAVGNTLIKNVCVLKKQKVLGVSKISETFWAIKKSQNWRGFSQDYHPTWKRLQIPRDFRFVSKIWRHTQQFQRWQQTITLKLL